MFVYWLYDDENWDIYSQGYVGISNKVKLRVSQHRTKLKKKFNFYKVIFSGSEAQCLALEFNLRPKVDVGWNLAKGGFEGYRKGHSKAAIEKLRAARAKQPSFGIGVKHSKESIERVRLANIGLKRSPEICAKMRLLRLNPSAETRAKISAAGKGRKASPETLAKLSATRMGHITSQETKDKIAASLRGKKHVSNRTEKFYKDRLEKLFSNMTVVFDSKGKTMTINDAEGRS